MNEQKSNRINKSISITAPIANKTVPAEAIPKGSQTPTHYSLDISVPNITKRIDRQGFNVKPSDKSLLSVNYDNADLIGKWSWNIERDWKKDSRSLGIIQLFHRDYHEKKTWGEIKREVTKGKQKHVYYPKCKITKEAQQRMMDIKMDDFENVFRFRLLHDFRFYGVVSTNVFLALWHDPAHKIYKDR